MSNTKQICLESLPLNPKQEIVFNDVLCNDAIRAICLYGSGRSGKTFLYCYWVLLRALYYPGSFHLFIRRTHTALISGVVSQTFPKLFDAIAKKFETDLKNHKVENKPFIKYISMPYSRFILYNGSEIRFIGLDTQSTNSTATDKVLSQEYFTVIFEEAPEIEFDVVEKVRTRLAQKVFHVATGKQGIPKWGCSLNPMTFDDWDYVYFQKHENPKDKSKLEEKYINQSRYVHFSIEDNLENISQEYLDELNNMSPMQRRRFLEGKHGENYDGEIFTSIHWETLPNIKEFDTILIYNDPSYKSGAKNDYKATGAIGRRNGAFWLIWGEAMQCTTNQMILNNYEVLKKLKMLGLERSVVHWFENAGMPDDFQPAVQKFAEETGWVCPFKLDGRQKGDKFARIEAALVPLNEQGKLFFNIEMKTVRFGNLVASQFGNFKKNMLPTDHDDIPDMVHGGVTLMNQPVLKPGGVAQVKRTMGKLG